MSLAEVFLRIGGALGALIILAAHGVILAAIPAVDCDPASGQPWLGTLFFGGLTAAALPLIGLGRPWSSGLRWIAVVLVPLLLYDASVVVPYVSSTLSGTHPCVVHGLEAGPSLEVASAAERAWAAVQLLVVSGGLLQVLRFWSPAQRLS